MGILSGIREGCLPIMMFYLKTLKFLDVKKERLILEIDKAV
jgi:hypothetical protein